MAQKLILTKSVINYDKQVHDFNNQQVFKNRIKRGNLRALQYSML
jgi:hypothetical protein